MKTERQVHRIMNEARDREAEQAAHRTLRRLMGASSDALLGLLSIDAIMVKYFEPQGAPYDHGRLDLREEDLTMVRQYLTYIYARERAHT